MKFSASKLESLEACPRYRADEFQDKSFADEGTLLHTAVETGSLTGLDDEQHDLVEACLSFKSSLPQGVVTGHEFGMSSDFGEDTLRGRIDMVLYPTRQHTIVVDWKFGKAEVTGAKNNLQGQAYALMAFDCTKSDMVTVHLVCPRQQVVHTHVFYRDKDYQMIRVRLQTIIDRVKDANIKATPSMDACRYCGAKATCAKIQALVLRQDYALIPVPSQEDLKLMLPETRGKLMDLTSILDSWIKQVKQENARFVREGGEVPGYSLKTRAGNPDVVNVPMAMDALVATFGLAKEDVLRGLTMPIGEMAKLVKTKTGAKDAAKMVRDAINTFVQVGEDISYLQRDRKTKDK